MTADGDRDGPAPKPPPGLRDRLARATAPWRERWRRLTVRHPKLAEIVRVSLAPDTIDRCFAVAAQIFITALPMAIAITAFLPHQLRNSVRDSLSQQLGIRGSTAETLGTFLNGQNAVREAIGVLGLVTALLSATSLTRRLQRLYEKQWELSPGRMKSSAARWLLWIVVWVCVLSAQAPVRSGHGGLLVAGWIASAVLSLGLWWWTPHLLLLRRITWRQLFPTALLTGLGQTVVGLGSRAVMPTLTGRSVREYGPFGLVLSLMSWLLVVAGVIVIGAGVGRILAEPAVEPDAGSAVDAGDA